MPEAPGAIKWNVDALRSYTSKLEQELNRLQSQHQHLITMRDTTAQSWSSPAGIMYQNRMNEDIESLNRLTVLLSRYQQELNEAVESCYLVCEEELKAKLRSLTAIIG